MSKSKRGQRGYKFARREREGERRLDAEVVQQLDRVSEAVEIVERKAGVDESRQPRFTEPGGRLASVYRWALQAMANEPAPNSGARVWDGWYRAYAKKEPLLFGVLNGAVQIDQNRGWTLTGGRNQVARYSQMLKWFPQAGRNNPSAAPMSWRDFVSWMAQSYYTTQMGFVAETGRQGRGGPIGTLWCVDPCRCELTGNPDYPLKYYPRTSGVQEWDAEAYFRACSLIDTDEAALGYGKPAVMRCYELAKIMVGVISHYQQKLGMKTPDAILTGKFISEDQWITALEARNESISANASNYLNSIATIMSSGADMPEFVLTTLSSLPDRWDLDLWTRILMRGYEMAFGYQGEFWPEDTGALGGNEVAVQHDKATGKGGKDFALQMQIQLQAPNILPAALEFQFDESDIEGDAKLAAAELAKAQVITELKGWGILSPEQLFEKAADQGLVPEEWTYTPDESSATDEQDIEDEENIPSGQAVPTEQPAPAGMSERVWRAMRAFPDEPIVRYSWPSDKTRVLHTVRRSVFYVPKVVHSKVKRTVGEVVTLYNDQLTNFTYEVLNGSMDATDMSRAHRALIRQLGPQSYNEGLREGGVNPDDADETDAKNITAWIKAQVGYEKQFALDAVAARGDDAARAAILVRVGKWVDSMRGIGQSGLLSAKKNRPAIWHLGETETHCKTCVSLDGKKHRVSWFLDRGYLPHTPGNEVLECEGWGHCFISDAVTGERIEVK